MKKVFIASRTHILALGLVLVSRYVPGEIAQAAIPAVAVILGLPVPDTATVEKAAAATVAVDVATVAADVAKAVPAAAAAVEAVVSPRSNA